MDNEFLPDLYELEDGGWGRLLPSNPAGLPPPSVREATLSVIAARCHLPRKGEVYCI